MTSLVRRSSSSRPLAAVVLGRRAMGTVAKGTNRAAVHGLRSPANTTVEGRKEAEETIERGKEEKQKTREQVERKVDDAQVGSSSTAPANGESRPSDD